PPPPPPPSQPPPPAATDKIDIADFAKVDLRVAQIKSAERVAGSKKLIKLQVDVGEATRQVAAGIAGAPPPQPRQAQGRRVGRDGPGGLAGRQGGPLHIRR